MENEEAEALSSNPTLDLDPTLQKKHQSMLERLSNRHQTRTDSFTHPLICRVRLDLFPFLQVHINPARSNLVLHLRPEKARSSLKKDPIGEPKEKQKKKEPEKSSFRVPASPGIWNKKGDTLVHNFKGSEVGEFTISDLDSCEVRLMDSVMALFVHRFEAKPRDFSGSL